ncbi:MAG: selenide, water dikinase SelD [Pseudomonadota bacterium]
MQSQPAPIAKDLILLGGGHSHVIVLRMFGMNPLPGLRITLISPEVRSPYSGMLPGAVAGHYSLDDMHIELMPLCQFAGAGFVRGTADAIDPDNKLVHVPGRPPIPYDVLSIDIGITPSLDVEGAEHVIPVKPISTFLARFAAFEAAVNAGAVRSVGFVGAGAGGVELALAIQYRLRHTFEGDYHLFLSGQHALPAYPGSVQRQFDQLLVERDFEVHTDFHVSAVTAEGDHNARTVCADDDRTQTVDAVFWVTQAASPTWLTETGLALDDEGFVEVNAALQTSRHPDVFATGDIASLTDPRPKAGVYAVRAGPVLYQNLKRHLQDNPLKAFKPQTDFLSLISTGDRRAVASRNGISVAGASIWRWKDWIDRRFMARFNDLPEMKASAPTGLLTEFDTQMQCAGCGSKVSGELLKEVLDEIGLNTEALDDAAILDMPPGQKLLHTVDSFRSFIDDPYLFSRIAVIHALSDIYAMGATPLDALAMVTIPYARPPKTRALLKQVLLGITDQLSDEGTPLSGGHSNEGTELTVGLAVNGAIDAAQLKTKGGMTPGEHLVLTKGLGTGVILAAHMQGKVRGEYVEGALQSMLVSNRHAVPLMLGYGVTAATDVTGFGLAGHLSEMLRASKVSARLNLDELPLLPGALDLINRGLKSSLHDGNDRSVAGMDESQHPHFRMLFDPQTAGGLLLSVAADQSETLCADLVMAGYVDAVVIGEIAGRDNMAIMFEGAS